MRWFVLILFLIPSLANSQTWDFDVSMDGKHIGEHQFSLSNKENNQQVLKSEAKFNVKFLTISVFNYHHKADELWENGCLKKLESCTKENSKTTLVKAYEEKSLLGTFFPKVKGQTNFCKVLKQLFLFKKNIFIQNDNLNI